MLDQKQAQAQLQAFRVSNWRKRRLADLASLPEELQEIGLKILGIRRQAQDPNSDPAPTSMGLVEWMESIEQAAKELDKQSPENRVRLFEALFPRLGSHVAQAWELGKRLPYQTGYTRKAFRAPYTPITSISARASWLRDLVGVVEGYEQDVRWFAAWAPYLGWNAPHTLGLLLAAAVEAGGEEGEEVFHILRASALGEHEIGAMGRHVIRALLIASRPEGWDLMERFLLAAQRQEGLRQAILESVDEAHPEAFRRMLRIILDHRLIRFSAVVRAVDVWFGFGWAAEDAREVEKDLRLALEFLEVPSARQKALETGDGRTVYLALWAIAFENALKAIEPAGRLLKDPDVERRFAAVYFLDALGLVASQRLLRVALDDPDLRVVAYAFKALVPRSDWDDFERLENLMKRLSGPTSQGSILWPWCQPEINRTMVADRLVSCLGSRPPERLIPYLPYMSPTGRAAAARELAKIALSSSQARHAILRLLGDPSPQVREEALAGLSKQTPLPNEIPYLEALLTRKVESLRREVLALLLKQEDEGVLASAQRLLSAQHPLQRRAGLELLRQMVEQGRAVERCQRIAEEFAAQTPRHTEEESNLLRTILSASQPPTLENALGLMNPDHRTPPLLPQIPPRFASTSSLMTPAAIALVKALDEWIHQHRDTPVIIRTGEREEEYLLGNVGWQFPDPQPHISREDDLARMPLREMWEAWWRGRPPDLRDGDGLELLRALAALLSIRRRYSLPSWAMRLWPRLFGDINHRALRYPSLVESVLGWILRSESPENAVDFLLDAVEFTLALVRMEGQIRAEDQDADDWRTDSGLMAWLELARQHREFWPDLWSPPHHIRLWRLLRWMDEPVKGAPRRRPELEEVLYAFEAGGATEADLLDHLLGPRGRYESFYALRLLSGRKTPPLAEQHPVLKDLVRRCRERIIEIELRRGDMPTAASEPARSLRYAGGMEVLLRLLQALGSDPLTRDQGFRNELGRSAVLSHLIRVTFPSEEDTPEAFAQRAGELKIPQRRWIELAVFAPQWARHVEHAIGWPGLEEAVWWIHAHTKDRRWHVPDEIREAWQAEISERTPLSADDLLDGAVDVIWFQRAYQPLGPERWEAIYAAAKLASEGTGHRRARLFADALLGRISREDLIERIRKKRDQDAVRAFGLLPLAEGEARDRDLLERYQLLQEFLRSGRQFGAMRRESEKRAVTIAMQNLARAAGYPDPLRFQWAMERMEIQDLAHGPLILTKGEITLKLEIDEWGAPSLTVRRNDRPLKHIPARLRKDPQVAGLLARKRELDQQVRRVRQALEQGMVRGDRFSGTELRALLRHPVVGPMLEQLVFVVDSPALDPEERAYPRMGYPVEGGKYLQSHDGRRIRVDENDQLRIAHPYDLFISGEWHLWQRECFLMERIQPFKQVFRELYLVTPAEKTDRVFSRRYAGHQVQPRQAVALLGQRGWVFVPEEGARRTFHEHRLSAWVTFLEAPFTPVEVEGLTIDTVLFTSKGGVEPLPLSDVPPLLFSEVMRDLDLVVSVAHVGGVDPEATASTIEMRAALIRETCAMLDLKNVRLQGSYALIEGQLSSYSVHLGSGVVHRMPGGALCIVPVHGQHRGRLFLPFADDDPKTAEVLSKILLLARDSEIKDPTILAQILA